MDEPPSDLDFFESSVQQVTGFAMDETRRSVLAAAVLARARKRFGGDVDAYRASIERAGTHAEILRLAAELSVGETHFFRQPEHWHALSEKILPERISQRGSPRALRLLSAGCSSGEEPYTMAIILSQRVPCSGYATPPILGLDIQDDFLRLARRAAYRPWSLRGVPAHIIATCFEPDGDQFRLLQQYRELVAFERRNLLDTSSEGWEPDTFDVVFLRNVVMYHTREAMRALVSRVARALVPGGYLFLGHAETLRGVSDEFHLVQSHGAFFYRRKASVASEHPAPRRSVPFGPALANQPLESDWMTAIHEASSRIAALRTRATHQKGAMVQPEPASKHEAPTSLAQLLHKLAELIGQAHYQAADALLQNAPPQVRGSTETLLLAAALDTNRGRVDAAVRAIEKVLAVDEFSADAHHLLALCHQQTGEIDAAVDENRIAIYLDPSFAAPHLHMARLAKARGDESAIRLELERAIELYPQELEVRVLLFGGGFGWEMLVRVCRRELEAGEDRHGI